MNKEHLERVSAPETERLCLASSSVIIHTSFPSLLVRIQHPGGLKVTVLSLLP